MKNIYLLFLLCFCASLTSFGQSAGRALTIGNETYDHKQFSQSEAAYRIASSKNEKKEIATYNLGNSLFRQKQNKEAISAYTRAVNEATTKETKHSAYHNLGNAYMAEKNYKAAEQAYKNALKNNPKDNETRYNYAVAKKLNEENPQDDQNQDNKDQDNKDQDNKDQDNKDKDNKDNKDPNQDKGQDKDNKGGDPKGDKKDQGDSKDNKDQNSENKQPPSPEQQKQQQSKEQMERILDAVNRDEQAVQQRLINKNKAGDKKGEAQGSTQRKKDW
ncbi:tetratricopeptide repeat protein [Myroides odoratus]|uniref:tetratricopeptide repeat protein n=1 Tax=Myroides odoratus TaxID=256 RepID=UPI0039AF4586